MTSESHLIRALKVIAEDDPSFEYYHDELGGMFVHLRGKRLWATPNQLAAITGKESATMFAEGLVWRAKYASLQYQSYSVPEHLADTQIILVRMLREALPKKTVDDLLKTIKADTEDRVDKHERNGAAVTALLAFTAERLKEAKCPSPSKAKQ